MMLSDELDNLETVFSDTVPIIYYIEAHPQFGPLVKEIVNCFQSGKVKEVFYGGKDLPEFPFQFIKTVPDLICSLDIYVAVQ